MTVFQRLRNADNNLLAKYCTTRKVLELWSKWRKILRDWNISVHFHVYFNERFNVTNYSITNFLEPFSQLWIVVYPLSSSSGCAFFLKLSNSQSEFRHIHNIHIHAWNVSISIVTCNVGPLSPSGVIYPLSTLSSWCVILQEIVPSKLFLANAVLRHISEVTPTRWSPDQTREPWGH